VARPSTDSKPTKRPARPAARSWVAFYRGSLTQRSCVSLPPDLLSDEDLRGWVSCDQAQDVGEPLAKDIDA
jgi:hypothetical protein